MVPVDDLGDLYGMVHERLTTLAADVPDPDRVPVPACPGWSVKDVVSHLTAVAEGLLGGTITRPPTDAETAAQVGARRDQPMADVLAQWAELAPRLQPMVREHQIWPAFLDVLSHEHDIRGAVNAPAHRDAPEVMLGAEALITRLRPPTAMTVRFGGRELRVGPDVEPAVRLDTDPFEAFRFRMGRRSRHQLASMAWTGDPEPVLGCLTIFGPATADLIE
ncbi:MAG TPA: maleylpyruvate isomerase N-terminal domain-containing protein [Pseudonocardiaceae bacterium]|jgi:uncharacterized protein (TIGR03083 family)|nr:maleylpyruvate isomerase N-terminal domain-containing protein [Pseudonocardiaceae bacterium]